MMDDKTTVEIVGPDGKSSGPLMTKEFHKLPEKAAKFALKNRLPSDAAAAAPIPSDDSFEGADFKTDDGLQTLGRKLIKDKFPDLAEFDIRFLWKREGGKKNGKAIMGRASLPKSLAAFYSKADVIIWAAANHLRALRATVKIAEAVLYHELCHVQVDEDEKTGRFVFLVGHDFEGFGAELREYGAWRTDLERMVEDAKQLRLI